LSALPCLDFNTIFPGNNLPDSAPQETDRLRQNVPQRQRKIPVFAPSYNRLMEEGGKVVIAVMVNQGHLCLYAMQFHRGTGTGIATPQNNNVLHERRDRRLFCESKETLIIASNKLL
jgi:hypothetical protein